MAKKNTKGAAANTAALTSDEFQKLSAEEQAAAMEKLLKENADLKAAAKQTTKEVLPSFDVEDDEENEIEGGEYQFTCQTFTWDDGSVIKVRELIADSESKDKKVAEKAQAILGGLVLRKSGIVKRKED